MEPLNFKDALVLRIVVTVKPKKNPFFFGRTFKLEQNLQVFMTFETFGEAQGGLYLDHSKHLFLTVIE